VGERYNIVTVAYYLETGIYCVFPSSFKLIYTTVR